MTAQIDLVELRRLAEEAAMYFDPSDYATFAREWSPVAIALLDRLEEAEKHRRALKALIGAAHAHIHRLVKTEAESAAERTLLALNNNDTADKVIALLIESVEQSHQSMGNQRDGQQ